MSTGIRVFIIGQHGSVIDMKAGNSWKTKFEDKSALLLALGTEQQQWWRNFRWLQQQLPKKQQGCNVKVTKADGNTGGGPDVTPSADREKNWAMSLRCTFAI